MLRERMTELGHSDQYLCPSLPASPLASIAAVLSLVEGVPPRQLALIGSSLGGYYAAALAEQLGCQAALLNPAIAPYRDLSEHVGSQPVYFSDAVLEFRAEYLDELRSIDIERITRPERYFLLAASGDTVIDYRAMVARFAGARQRVIDGSDHELSDFEQYLDEVLEFCGIGIPNGAKGISA